MSDLPKAYPLQWPADWKRTERSLRVRSPYRATFASSRDGVVDELRKMSAGFVITTNVPLGARGLPSTDYREPEDPGVAVYWIVRGSMRVLACDAWASVRENMRALGYALESLRTLERCKSTQILARAMQGFTALPAPRPPWFSELGLEKWPPTPMDIRLAFQRRALDAHPDRGGSAEAFLKLTQARDLALAAAALEQPGAAP
jgi:hypothetical protein